MQPPIDSLKPPLPSLHHLPYERQRSALTVEWASSDEQMRDAQRLRHEVFVMEFGARPVAGAHVLSSQYECDRFDPFCDHLLVRAEPTTQAPSGAVVGTCRVLRPDQARRAGGFYCDAEFTLRALAPILGSALEMGRSCVHPTWRSGTVIMTMWRALGQFMQDHSLDTLFGCASIWLGDGGVLANRIWEHLRVNHLVQPMWQVQPLLPVPYTDTTSEAQLVAPEIPPLIKGYLRCGARVLGPPALDIAFNTADLPMMLRFDDLTPRYRQHFFTT